MSYADRLTSEINTLLDLYAEEGKEWHATWIANEICSIHAPALLEGTEDTEFWRHCGYSDCRREVRQCINRRAGDSDADRATRAEQHTLPGFEHLQAYYVVERDDEAVGVPVHGMTDAELAGKAAMYRAMGRACFAHADELDRFRNLRAVDAAGD